MDGPAASARFRHPAGLVTDTEGNVFVGDAGNMRVRWLSPAGEVGTVAGCGQAGWRDGPAPEAQFQFPAGIGMDYRRGGPALLVADYMGHTIRSIDASGMVTTVAGVPGESGQCDGPAQQARFTNPSCVQVGPTGDIFVVDRGNHCIRRIDPWGLAVSTFAGGQRPGLRDGPGGDAEFRMPSVLAVDWDGMLWVSDTENHAIRRIDPDGTVTTVAGNGSPGLVDGQGADARFNCPLAVVLDSNGDLVVADMENHCIRLVTRTGVVTTLLAPPSSSATASPPTATAAVGAAVCPCLQPGGVALTHFAELVIADFNRHHLFILNIDLLAYRRDPRRRALPPQLSEYMDTNVLMVAGKLQPSSPRAARTSRGRYCAGQATPDWPAPSTPALPDLDALLRFLHAGEMRGPDHVLGLMDVCGQFGVDDGYALCLQYCRRHVSPTNAVRWLVEAHCRGLADLTRWLRPYVTQQWDAIRATAPQSFNLMQPYPELLEASIPDHMRLPPKRLPALRPPFRPLRASLVPHPIGAGPGYQPDHVL
eukprot:EG_transcript_5302